MNARTSAGDPSRPLCPAGHLPHEWGDWPSSPLSLTSNAEKRAGRRSCRSPPLVGEMPDRAEGGAVPPT
ncbi:MAG: hypothetical protein E5X67_36295, partial [Mesorhizobium sp.]